MLDVYGIFMERYRALLAEKEIDPAVADAAELPTAKVGTLTVQPVQVDLAWNGNAISNLGELVANGQDAGAASRAVLEKVQFVRGSGQQRDGHDVRQYAVVMIATTTAELMSGNPWDLYEAIAGSPDLSIPCIETYARFARRIFREPGDFIVEAVQRVPTGIETNNDPEPQYGWRETIIKHGFGLPRDGWDRLVGICEETARIMNCGRSDSGPDLAGNGRIAVYSRDALKAASSFLAGEHMRLYVPQTYMP
ncbi:MAG: hypothetical protein ABH879_01160 [archaeon]